MNKKIFFIGIGIFVIGFVLLFLSGSTSGPSPEQATPTVPFIYGTNQLMWMFFGLIGIIVAIVGIFKKAKVAGKARGKKRR